MNGSYVVVFFEVSIHESPVKGSCVEECVNGLLTLADGTTCLVDTLVDTNVYIIKDICIEVPTDGIIFLSQTH